MINLPSIELENDQDSDYMVLCYDGRRLDLEEFFYHPKTLYQLTHKATKEKKLFWVVGYEMPHSKVLEQSIAKDDVQINLLLREVKSHRGKLMASSDIASYDFPACLDDVLSPDDWAIAPLNNKVTLTRVDKRPTLISIYKKDESITKLPIDLSRTSLGQVSRRVTLPSSALLPVVEERPQPEVSSELTTFWVRRDDAQRVTRILMKWVDVSSVNPFHLAWVVVSTSSTGFNILRKGELIFSFDPNTRELSSPLTLEKIKGEIETMAAEAIKNHSEDHNKHELARHLFLRSVSFTEDSFSGFWLHMLSLKKAGNDLKSNPYIRRTRRIPRY